MSSAVVSTSAALGRPFVFDDEAEPEVCSLSAAEPRRGGSRAQSNASPLAPVFVQSQSESTIKNPPARNPGLAARNPSRAGNGFQRHPRPRCPDRRPAPRMPDRNLRPRLLRTHHLLLAALAAATRRGEFCVVVDASDALDPQSAAAAGVELDRLLWVRCGDSSPQRHLHHRDQPENISKDRSGRVPHFSRVFCARSLP